MNDEPLTTTIRQAAKEAGIGVNQAYEAAKRGEIPTIKIGKRISTAHGLVVILVDDGEHRGDTAAAAEMAKELQPAVAYLRSSSAARSANS